MTFKEKLKLSSLPLMHINLNNLFEFFYAFCFICYFFRIFFILNIFIILDVNYITVSVSLVAPSLIHPPKVLNFILKIIFFEYQISNYIIELKNKFR